MERLRISILQTVSPDRWRAMAGANINRLRHFSRDVSIWPLVWLGVLYLLALCAFHSAAH